VRLRGSRATGGPLCGFAVKRGRHGTSIVKRGRHSAQCDARLPPIGGSLWHFVEAHTIGGIWD